MLVWYTSFRLINPATRLFRQARQVTKVREPADTLLPCIEADPHNQKVIWVSVLAVEGSDPIEGAELCKAALENAFPRYRVLMLRPVGA